MDLNIASGTMLLSADQTVVLANTAVASDRAKVIMGNSNLGKPQEGRREATSADISTQKSSFPLIVKVKGRPCMHDLPLFTSVTERLTLLFAVDRKSPSQGLTAQVINN